MMAERIVITRRSVRPQAEPGMRVAALIFVAFFAALGGALGTWALVEHYDGSEPSVTPEPPIETGAVR